MISLSNSSDGFTVELSKSYIGMMGYYASLKICRAGLVLVKDISFTCFLAGGSLVDMLVACLNCKSVDEMISIVNTKRGLEGLKKLEGTLKGCKVKVVHLNHWRKFKTFGIFNFVRIKLYLLCFMFIRSSF